MGQVAKKDNSSFGEGKKPRVKMKILMDSYEKGGLQVPNLKLYHEAVCLAWIKDWITLSNNKLLGLEGFQ